MSGLDPLVNEFQSQSNRIGTLQRRIASGSKLVKPSDGPTDSVAVERLSASLRAHESRAGNVQRLDARLKEAGTALEETRDTLRRTQQLLEQAGTATVNQDQRRAIAEEINGLLEGVIGTVNNPSVGRHLFSGTALDRAPYAVERGPDGDIQEVRYQGTSGSPSAAVAAEVEQPVSFVGREVFRNDERGTVSFTGDTGAAPGSGPSNVRGHLTLEAEHASSAITTSNGSGVQLGPSSPSQDTILGDHQITVDTDNRSVRLDSGEAVSFDPATDNNLKVTNADGAAVHLDMTSTNLGNGVITETVRGDGTLSIDGGQNTPSINFGDANQKVTDADTGRFLRVDSTQIRQAGEELVRVEGTEQVFETLVHARDVLRNETDLTAGEQNDTLQRALGAVEDLFARVNRKSAALGSQQRSLEELRKQGEDDALVSRVERSSLKDVDIAEAATKLAEARTAFQATLRVTSRANQTNLFQFL